MIPKRKIDGLKGRIRQMRGDVEIDTVMGTTSLREEVEIPVPNLGMALHAALVETPTDILSVGLLCREHRFRFCWEPGEAKPSLTDSFGRNIPVHVEHNVPYIGHRGAKACFSGKHAENTRDIGVGATASMG